WTKVKLKLNIFEILAYNAVFTLLESSIQKKVSEKSWKEIKELDPQTFGTYGEVERFAIKIIDREWMEKKKHQDKKVFLHGKLKQGLSSAADKGLWSSRSVILDLMKSKK